MARLSLRELFVWLTLAVLVVVVQVQRHTILKQQATNEELNTVMVQIRALAASQGHQLPDVQDIRDGRLEVDPEEVRQRRVDRLAP